jgi:SAM-dependent methyltransferase
MNQPCPLCNSYKYSLFSKSENREYYRCTNCDLVFVPSSFFVSSKEEKAKYDNHQNSYENDGYKEFLSKVLNPMIPYLKQNSYGLDFGCGPGPTLSIMFEQLGHKVELYDHFYKKNPSVFNNKYDFITATEVIEHLHNPMKEIKRLWKCLKPNAILGIMSAFRPETSMEFSKWYYKRDLTHIMFYNKNSLNFISKTLEARLIIPQSGVALLIKS